MQSQFSQLKRQLACQFTEIWVVADEKHFLPKTDAFVAENEKK